MISEKGALSGLKVLDLTHYVAGPYCTKLLATYGADVIKVEKPGTGDGARLIGAPVNGQPDPEASALFLYLNTDKKSVTLDLKSSDSKEILKRLVGWADVLVESFRPGYLQKLGLGYEYLKKLNPRLIMVSISNFGATGPYRDYRATELIEYALSGIMYMLGTYEGSPLKHGLLQGQYFAGGYAASATVAAVYANHEDNSGQFVDVSIMESMMPITNFLAALYPYAGAVMRRLPKSPRLYEVLMKTADGYLAPVFYGYTDWKSFSTMMNCPELDVPKFDNPTGRDVNAQELLDILNREFAKWKTRELVSTAQAWRFPFGMVQTIQDLSTCEQLLAREYFATLTHPHAGKITMPRAPFKMAASPARIESPAPLLGQHNAVVYSGLLGFSGEDIVRLRNLGAI
ncbi:MAG: CoA transferase [Chloroflexi bacterium]|nr:CoA transferase [Chloroflexota bacterium]